MNESPPPKSWEVEIPGYCPPSVNKLLNAHWSRRSKIKRGAADIILLSCYVAGVPAASGPRRIGFQIRLADMRKAPDADNVWKVLLDSLKTGRVLKDDSPKWCQQGRHDVERNTSVGTTIFIEDLY